MAPTKLQAAEIWRLVAHQHGVVSRPQLLELGLSSDAVKHRLATGRLRRVHRGVYAVGRPELTVEGTWMAAVLSGGPGAVLSHTSAAALWRIRSRGPEPIHVSIPATTVRRGDGIAFHRRTLRRDERVTRDQIPATTPAVTLVDLAATLPRAELEDAINEADKLELIGPLALREALARSPPRPGVAKLRRTLDRATLTLTDSALERCFLALVRAAEVPLPQTQAWINGSRVDFYWPELGLICETDGLRYHRTPAAQARDRARDQVHTAAGLTVLRFTHAQVRYEPATVIATLAATARRLRQRT